MNNYKQNEPEKIDLMNSLSDVIRAIKKLWWLVIGLALILASKEYFTVSRSYYPKYIASATMAVRCSGNEWEYVNEETAKQMEKVFPYILKAGILQKEVAVEMGLDSMPGSISMSAEPGTNLFTISANAGDPELSYELLQATLKKYPEVARFVVGEIEMEILDETGIPKDTGKEVVLRGSFKEGAIEGASIGLGIMAIYVLTRNTVKTRKELMRIINLSDCGSIPLVKQKKRKKKDAAHVVNINKTRVPQYYLEAIRKLRIKVGKEMESKGYKSLLVTSSIPGEGKTTVAVNLALAFVRQGKKVILVDCDARHPSIAQCLGEQKEHPGIGAILRGQSKLAEAITAVKIEGQNLYVVYGGKPESSVAQLFGTEKMKKFLDMLKEQADIVVLDTAPCELLADATVLARNVDAALYVVKCDHAKKNRIRNGVQALSASDIPILGYVFNADNSKRSSGYGYGYGYKNYSSYYGYGRRKREDNSGRVIKD